MVKKSSWKSRQSAKVPFFHCGFELVGERVCGDECVYVCVWVSVCGMVSVWVCNGGENVPLIYLIWKLGKSVVTLVEFGISVLVNGEAIILKVFLFHNFNSTKVCSAKVNFCPPIWP